MKTFTKESLISELKKIRSFGWVKNARPGNAGGVGNTLEDLLGIEENNLPLPNANEWELKCQRNNTSSLTTLFHSEPSPTALRLVPQILLLNYGWKHKEAGTLYSENELSFRQTIGGSNRSDRGFMVVVDRKEQKILISFDYKSVSSRHQDWLNCVKKKIGLGEINPQPYWGFRDLQHIVGTKLPNCFYISADVKIMNGEEYYSYNNIQMLQNVSFDKFLNSIVNNETLVDFDARTGHNHGTKFRMRQNILPNLYETVKVI